MINTEEILSHITSQGIINTHAHHLPDSEMSGLCLEKILKRSYVSWCGEAIPSSSAVVDNWLEKIENRSYYINLSRSLQKLYSVEKPLGATTWDEYDNRIQRAHKNPQWHMDILRDICGYRSIVQDSYWNPGDNNNHPEIFKPAFRVDFFLKGYNHETRDHDGNNVQLAYGLRIDNINEFTDFMYRTIKEKKEAGCSCLKSAVAYDRTLAIETSSAKEAQEAMGFDRSEPSTAAVRKFQDYIFETLCNIAAELEFPLQIHTGLGKMTGTNPMQLQPLIARHPATQFILMHGGYPWLDDTLGLVHVYHNIIVDLCWLPLISPSAGIRALHELFEVCNGDKIVWGCDTWTSEESLGALLSMVNILATVLNEKIASGYLNNQNAFNIVRSIMQNNAEHWFCF